MDPTEEKIIKPKIYEYNDNEYYSDEDYIDEEQLELEREEDDQDYYKETLQIIQKDFFEFSEKSITPLCEYLSIKSIDNFLKRNFEF